jgi:hypothetical protein
LFSATFPGEKRSVPTPVEQLAGIEIPVRNEMLPKKYCQLQTVDKRANAQRLTIAIIEIP